MTIFRDSLSGIKIVFNGHFFAVQVFLLVLGMVFLGLSGCKKPSVEPGAEPGQSQSVGAASSPKLSLPIQRTLTDQKGRKVAVTIVERSPTHISIIRKSDQKPFDLEVGKLAEADRIFVEQLPVSGNSNTSSFVTSRRAEIRKLENEIQQHNNALASGTLNGSQTSMVNGKIERLNREILDLKNQIVEYEK